MATILSELELRAKTAADAGQRVSDGGGLFGAIRLDRNGRLVVGFEYRFRSPLTGKPRAISCGIWPDKGLKAIRLARDEFRLIVDSGADPLEGKRVKKLAVVADQAEAAEKQARRLTDIEVRKARMTVGDLFDRWERIELARRKDKGAEARRSFSKDVLPALGALAAEDVKRGMVAACLDRVVERGSTVYVRNLLGDLRQMFGFGIKRGFFENDPTSHLKRDDFGRKNERDRVLDDTEIRRLVELLPLAGLQESGIAALWIMLGTCCRVGEIAKAKWEHIDLTAGTWRIPPENAKNRKEHVVFLSDFAKGHFAVLRRLATDENGSLHAFAMPAKHHDAHVCEKSLSKQVGDRQRGDKPAMKNRSPFTRALELPRGKWTPHDLRRTGATLMGRLGVRPDVIEKCLNHVEQNRLVRIYQRQELAAEQAEAWRLLGERLELLTSGENNVIPLTRAG